MIAMPAIIAVAAMAGMIAALLIFGAHQVDELATNRQQRTAAAVFEQSRHQIAHEQEAITVWNDAVAQVHRRPLNLTWVDTNLGTWLYNHFGHDEAFILDPHNQAIYAMREGKRVAPAQFASSLGPPALPLVTALRRKLGTFNQIDRAGTMLSPGVVDLALANHHAAFISVKPFLPESGALPAANDVYLHVSVRYLDGEFSHRLAASYDLAQASIMVAHPAAGRISMPLVDDKGAVVAYLSWRAFDPGSLVIRQVRGVALLALLLVLVGMTIMLRRIRQSTRELEASEAAAQHQASHDPLTGLANRVLFELRMAEELAAGSQAFALLYLDLDGFKNINDALGHPAGDELIRLVADRMQNLTGSSDMIARLGGDEFAILAAQVDSGTHAEILCACILDAMQAPFAVAGRQVHVALSIGIALAPHDAQTPTELARKADIALYEAKRAGRGRFIFFYDAMDAAVRDRETIENGLRAALHDGVGLELYYQPLFAATTGQSVGAEALVRWHHPTIGPISPASFIPVAEEAGLIHQLGEWVLRQACRTAAKWSRGSVSVNVSALQMRAPRFAELVVAILHESGLDPSRLELEITETSLMESVAACRSNLSTLRSCGIQIALDDFGTGYSSLSMLRSFSVDRVKIDRSFVSAIGVSHEGAAIVAAIIDIARAMNLKVTAEGVETDDQRDFLTKSGCTTLQGYLFSRPVNELTIGAIFHATNDDGLAALLPLAGTA